MCLAEWDKVFDFDFPMYDGETKQNLCTLILMHYYTREIGLETVGLWKQFLETRMLEIMPYYVNLAAANLTMADAFENRNISEVVRRTGSESEDTNRKLGETNSNELNSTEQGTSNRDTTSTFDTERNGQNLSSDTPQDGLQSVINGTYLSNAVITNDTGTDSNRGTDILDTDSNMHQSQSGTRDMTDTGSRDKEYGEDVSRETFGFDGDKLDTLTKYRESILQIPRMIIGDLADLFLSIL